MKTKKVSAVAVVCLAAILCVAGCHHDSGGKGVKDGDIVYTEELACYDLGVDPYNLYIDIGEGYKIESVAVSRYSTDDYSYKNGILSIPGEFFTQQTAGEKTLVVTFKDGTSKRIDLLICTKFIYTAEDFQSINDNLDGTYVLANDIDLSSISNFEPLGWYYEETDPTNHYFHGVLEGNGYAIKNGNVEFSKLPSALADWDGVSYPSDSDVYYGTYGFELDAHVAGDNIGLFQMIGSSGIVRNCVFDNIKVVGRTICGVIAGNCSGTIENCVVRNSSVHMATHFYDDDCNCGGAVGIVASGAVVSNTIVYNTSVTIEDFFIDFGDTYIGQAGNGWDHAASGTQEDEPEWIFCGVDKTASNVAYTDSNGQPTNGVYAFVGKCWGDCVNCFAESFTVTQPTLTDFTPRTVCFGQTHVGANKPDSGDSDLGTFTNCDVYTSSELKSASLYTSAGYDTSIWDITDGSFPTLRCPLIPSYVYGA